MNWGKAIILTFVLFAGFIGGMVFLMSRQRIDLVRDDYYQDELAFQQHINRVERAARLQKPVAMTYEPTQQQLALVLPQNLRRGEITFYRPSDRRQDFRLNIAQSPQSRRVVSTASLAKGYWRVQVAWSDGQQDYYAEDELFIQ